MDLTPYLEADNGAWKNTFGGAGLGVGKVGDSYYSVPLRTTATLMIYNKTMMDEHGWKEPATQEEFEALMEEIKAAGITPLICPGNPEGYQIAVIGNNFAEHKLYANGKLEDPEYRSGHISGSINCPIDKITEENILRRFPDKTSQIFIVGSYTQKPGTAVKKFKNLGYKNAQLGGYMEEHHGMMTR